MKRLFSILILVLLAFVEAYSLHHRTEHLDSCHENTFHFCEQDNHHHCEICDHYTVEVTLHADLVYPSVNSIVDILAQLNTAPAVSSKEDLFSSRGPPVV